MCKYSMNILKCISFYARQVLVGRPQEWFRSSDVETESYITASASASNVALPLLLPLLSQLLPLPFLLPLL